MSEELFVQYCIDRQIADRELLQLCAYFASRALF